MATSNANITSPVPGTTQVPVQNDAKSTSISRPQLGPDGRPMDPNGYRSIEATPRGAAGGAYEAGLTGQPIQANAPVNFATQAAKVQANPQFQAAYADQTVAGRTNADRVLSGMNPQQIAQEKVKDANWNAQQAAFDAANPVGTKMAEPTQPIQPAMAKVAPQPAQNAAIAPQEAPAQPKEAKAPQTPKDVAASIFAQNPGAKINEFQNYINSNGIAGTPQENQVWDAYHELQHLQNGMQKYGTSDLNSLSAAISNGDLAVGSPTWNAVAASNPNASLAKQKYEADLRTKTNNELASKLVGNEGGKSVSSTDDTPVLEKVTNKVVDKMNDPLQVFSLAEALASNPEVTKNKEKVVEMDAKIDDLTRAKMKNYEDLKKQYPNVPQSVIMGMEAKMDKDLDDQIFIAQRDRNSAASMMSYYAEIAKSQVEAKNEITKENRAVANQQALMTFKQKLDSEGTATDLVDLGNKKVLINKATGAEVATFDVSKPLTDQFEFRTEKVGNSEVTAIYSKATGKLISRSEVPTVTGGVVFDKDQADLRKEFNSLPDVKGFSEVSTAYEKVAKAAELANKDPKNAAADIAMIFGYMKILDPTSVVREGEFATAQNAGSIPTSIQNAYNKALNGQFQTPKQRADIVKNAEQVFSTYKDRYDARQKEYEGYGMKLGFVQPTQTTVNGKTDSGQTYRSVGSTTDNIKQLAQLKSANPKEAGPKYNNLGGITFRGASGREMPFVETMKKAGIKFEEGGVRGVDGKEGGTYVKFASVGDGVDAYNLLWKTNSYQNKTLSEAMGKWGTGNVGLDAKTLSMKVSEVDPKLLSKVKALQIAKESPAMFQYLKDNGLLKHL